MIKCNVTVIGTICRSGEARTDLPETVLINLYSLFRLLNNTKIKNTPTKRRIFPTFNVGVFCFLIRLILSAFFAENSRLPQIFTTCDSPLDAPLGAAGIMPL